MKVIKPLNLGIIYKSCVIGDAPLLSLAACACFTLDEGAPNRLIDEPEMWPLIEVALGPEESFDFGFPKHRGEYLVYGSAYAPRPVPGLEVSVRVGDMSKNLAVFGDRYWELMGAGKPAPFNRMAISYANAFGGPEFPQNPLGKGILPDITGGKPVPNIQDPRCLISSPGEKPPPAGFSALPMEWPQRQRHLGKVDENWLRDDWPHFPKDTNWEFFNTAPEDQRCNGFFSGREIIEIVNMHPAKPLLKSSLPALRPRLFVHQREGDREVFREIPCRAETLWLFPDREAGILLYRGTVPVADEDYEDVLHLYGIWESLNEPPLPLEEYGRRFQEEITPPPPEWSAAAPPPPEPASAPAAAPPPPDTGKISPELAALQKDAEELEATSKAMLKKAGLDPEETLKRFFPAGELTAAAAGLSELTAAVAALEKQTAAFMKRFNISAADVGKIMAPKPEAPAATAEEIITELRKGGFHKPEIEAQLRELEDMTKKAATALDDLANKKKGASAAAPPPPPEPPPPPPAELVLSVEEVMARHGRGESLSGLDLSGLDFTGRRLAGADFTGTVLAGAIFSQTVLTRAVFKNAILKEGDFRAADMSGAILEEVDGTGGIFRECRLPGANLAGGDFTGADFTDADLTGGNATGSVFADAVMIGIKARKITAPRAQFSGANLTDADLTETILTDADFTRAQLTHCAFNWSQARGLSLNGATGEYTKFGMAFLESSRADAGTSLTDARFFAADLRDAAWEGARLPRAQLIEAVMDGADFSKCDLTGASLILATAKEAKFMKADLSHANLTGINLFKGSLRKASLIRTDLKMSNLYGVDFYQARMERTNLDLSNIKRTLLNLRPGS